MPAGLGEVPAEGVVITKRGQPVARLVALERSGRGLIGALEGRIRDRGDITRSAMEWEAGRRE
jgi:antitoxin (DNA-binding transcriptional repressor) of toxin-antitoxin stability system